jgi:hypothetical protein
MKKLFLFLILITATILSYSQPANVSVPDMVVQYQADIWAMERKYTVKISSEYIERMQAFHQTWMQQLTSTRFDALNYSDQVDYILLKRNISRNLYTLAQSKETYNQITRYLPFEKEMMSFIQLRRRGNRPDAQATAVLFDQLKSTVSSAKSNAEKLGKLSYRNALHTADAIDQLTKALEDAHKFYLDYDPLYTWWCSKPYEELNTELKKFSGFIKEFRLEDKSMDDGSGIIGSPIGDAELVRQLEFEFIAHKPADLLKIAEREFAWCEKEMLRASNDLGHGNNWKAALEQVKNTYVEPGMQPEMVNGLAEQAIEFIESRNLVTVPELAKETWRTRMLSAEQQLFSPFFLGGEMIQISYPTQDMPHDAKMMSMRGNNPNFSKSTVHHELIPGHHLQQFMQQRYKSHRNRSFGTPFWTEGWALYWEMLLWDEGFPETPEERIGMLFWRMHRCARIIFSISYHTNKMTAQQCIDLLVDKVGHERANAEAEVRRSLMGNYGPLYQMAYMLGGLQFRALYKDLVTSGKMTPKEFHDTILQENNLPVELVKAILTNQKLNADYKANWKF